MFILDTPVVVELRRSERTDPQVRTWAQAIPLGSFYLCAITVLELELGAHLKAQDDAEQGSVLRDWLDVQVWPNFEGRILAADTAVMQRCAQLLAGRQSDLADPRDMLIAATASVHSMTVATRNRATFEWTGVQIFDPWAG